MSTARIRIDMSLVLTGVAITVWDWLLCFDQEVSLIWTSLRSVKASSVIYLLSRYTMIISEVTTIPSAGPTSLLVNLLFFDSGALDMR